MKSSEKNPLLPGVTAIMLFALAAWASPIVIVPGEGDELQKKKRRSRECTPRVCVPFMGSVGLPFLITLENRWITKKRIFLKEPRISINLQPA